MCWYIGGLITLHCYVFLNFILASLYNKKHVNLLIVVSQWLLRLVDVGGLLWLRNPCMKGTSMGSNTKN